jgi:hypothetical protein
LTISIFESRNQISGEKSSATISDRLASTSRDTLAVQHCPNGQSIEQRRQSRFGKKTIGKVKRRTVNKLRAQAPVAFSPRTELGKRLWFLRSRVAASGAKPLDWDEIHRELMSRRQSIVSEDE